MWHEFIAFGGVIFWSIAAVVALVLAVQVENKHSWWAGITLAGFFAFLIAFTNTPIVETIKTHPEYVFYGILVYLVGAAVWATIKWRYFFLPALFERYNEVRQTFLNRRGLKEMPADPQIRQEFKEDYTYRSVDIDHNRQVSHNKARITGWMIFWPFSLIGTFVADFLYRVFTNMYHALAAWFQRMSDTQARNYSELD
jgi:hypothetical protein